MDTKAGYVVTVQPNLNKVCKSCDATKPLDEFHTHPGGKFGKRAICKACVKIRYGERQKKDQKAYLKTEKGRAAKRRREVARKQRNKANFPEKAKMRVILQAARRRAKQKDLAFDLDINYLMSILPKECPVFRVPFDFRCKHSNPNSPSIDRFYSERGYTKGNVFIISHLANTMKSSGTIQQHMALTNWLLRIEIELGCSNLVLFPTKAA